MYCKKCGAYLAEGSTFCNACGTNQISGTSGPDSHVIISSGSMGGQGMHPRKGTEEGHGGTLPRAGMVQAFFCFAAVVFIFLYVFAPWSKAKRALKQPIEGADDHSGDWEPEKGHDEEYWEYEHDLAKLYPEGYHIETDFDPWAFGSKMEPFWLLLSPYEGFRSGETLPKEDIRYPVFSEEERDDGNAFRLNEKGILVVDEKLFGAEFSELNRYLNNMLSPLVRYTAIPGVTTCTYSDCWYSDGFNYRLFFFSERLVAVRYTEENVKLGDMSVKTFITTEYVKNFDTPPDEFSIQTGYSSYDVYQWFMEMNNAKGSYALLIEYPSVTEVTDIDEIVGPTVIAQVTSPYWALFNDARIQYREEKSDQAEQE